MRTLYFRERMVRREEPGVAVLHVTPLLRELILEAVCVGRLRARFRYERALRDLLVSQLDKASPIPTAVTLPMESRAISVAQAILRDPAESQSMKVLCGRIGVSVRTVERIYRKEVGISFEAWRQQVRLMKAIELLVEGCSIKETAFRIGYRQPSTFVGLFRRTFGTTPKTWVSVLKRAD
jgi:transcriptional regulator GlxA family with amidase domain